MKYFLILTFILLGFLIEFQSHAYAQIPHFGIANTYPIDNADWLEIKDGDIVSLDVAQEKLIRSRAAYDTRMFGVVDLFPQVVYKSIATGSPVVRNGELFVNVSTLNGPIVAGDFVTSSSIPGRGQKSTELAGYMLGVALTNFDENTPEATSIDYESKKILIGRAKVAVGIGPSSPALIKAAGGLFGTIKFFISSLALNIQTTKQAERVIRIIIAGTVALLTLLINFYTFGRNITKGIESIGRNPLARVAIQSMIILNIILIAVVSIGGIILSLAIISL